MPDDLTQIAEQLLRWDQLPPAIPSALGQLDLFDTGRGLAKRQREDYAKGQDFLFDPRTMNETDV